MSSIDLQDVFSLVVAASKDKAYCEGAERVNNAYKELKSADAKSRRKKTTALILSMAKLDSEIKKFRYEYSRVHDQLTPDARTAIEEYIKIIECKKKLISLQKKGLRH